MDTEVDVESSDEEMQDDVQIVRGKKKKQGVKDTRLKTNSEFWTEFLKKNLQYQTGPFGGNNPVFIPFKTDEQKYEDKYIHNEMAQHL